MRNRVFALSGSQRRSLPAEEMGRLRVRTVRNIEQSASLAEIPADASRQRDNAIARLRHLRVALVHDWLVTLGGADRVLLALHHVFPQAPVFVGVHDLRGLPEAFRQLDVRATWLQQIPGAARRHRLLVPLMPLAFSRLVLRGYDVVISSSHACSHSVSTPGARHICYCHTPMRYAWDLRDEYLAALPGVTRPAARVMLAWLRRRDSAAAAARSDGGWRRWRARISASSGSLRTSPCAAITGGAGRSCFPAKRISVSSRSRPRPVDAR